MYGIFYLEGEARLRIYCVYYTMGKPKFEAIIKQTNRFAALAEPDSDDDLPDYATSPTFGSQDFTYFQNSQPLELSEKEVPIADVGTSADLSGSPFRVWKNDITRFSSDTNNIFSSPFSRKRTTKKEEDGWTSIESGPFSNGPRTEGAGTATTQEFPSMLSRGDVDAKEWADAKAWAAVVNTSLDKARHRKMSFFRRNVVLDEKF